MEAILLVSESPNDHPLPRKRESDGRQVRLVRKGAARQEILKLQGGGWEVVVVGIHRVEAEELPFLGDIPVATYSTVTQEIWRFLAFLLIARPEVIGKDRWDHLFHDLRESLLNKSS